MWQLWDLSFKTAVWKLCHKSLLNDLKQYWVMSRPEPNSLPQELWHGFSASWESSICERKLHYPGNRTQNLLLSGEISYHTSVCWVKKTCGHSPLYPNKVGPPWLPTIRLRADTLPHPLGKPRTRGTYPLRDRHSPDGMQSRNPPGVKVEQGAGTLA